MASAVIGCQSSTEKPTADTAVSLDASAIEDSGPVIPVQGRSFVHPAPSAKEAPKESDQCADCHPEAVAAFQKTGMGRALYRPQDGRVIEDFSAAKAVIEHPRMPGVYTAYIDEEGRWWQSESVPGTDYHRAVEVAYVIGSGNQTRSYLGYVDGELVQLPLTWYTRKAIWDMIRAMKAVDTCAFCGQSVRSAFSVTTG